MADPILRPSDPAECVLALKDRLVAACALDPAAVLITALPIDRGPHSLAEQDVVLRMGDDVNGSPPASGDSCDPFPGGGRYATLRTRTVEVYCRSRAYLDLGGT